MMNYLSAFDCLIIACFFYVADPHRHVHREQGIKKDRGLF